MDNFWIGQLFWLTIRFAYPPRTSNFQWLFPDKTGPGYVDVKDLALITYKVFGLAYILPMLFPLKIPCFIYVV